MKDDRKNAAMRKAYGSAKPLSCGQCPHLLKTMPTDRVYYKCEAYGVSNGEGTDWAKRWEACNLIFRESIAGLTPMLEQLKRSPRKKPEEQLEGQIAMDI